MGGGGGMIAVPLICWIFGVIALIPRIRNVPDTFLEGIVIALIKFPLRRYVYRAC